MNIDERLLAYKPISITLNFDWDNTTYDERVQMRHDYIEEQKKKDLNYVGYDFPEYFNDFTTLTLNKPNVVVTDFSKLVNTLGQFLFIKDGKIYISLVTPTPGKYKLNWLLIGNKRMQVRTHRVIACTFIPIPEHLKEQRTKIVVNHKNDIKTCNLRSNLEWCTRGENNIKALNTGSRVSCSFKYTVNLPGRLFGKEYYFLNRKDLVEHGFEESFLYSIVNSKNYLHGRFETISKEQIKDKPIGIPKEVIDELRNPKYGRPDSSATVGTIISEGPCKGEKFVIYGPPEIKKYGFSDNSIYNFIRGNTVQYKGCTWEKLDRNETVDIPIGLTEAQKEHIFGKSS